MTFSPAEAAACNALVELALTEDLGERGDITSVAFIPADLFGQAAFVARTPGVLAGIPAAQRVIERISSALTLDISKRDGDALQRGDRIAVLRGPMRALLAAERTALNFLQRLSGIATLTRKYVDAVSGLNAKILDTRKTTPGWRLLEKYAVRMGGGVNHRIGLYDAMMVKDNHLAGMRNAEGRTRNDDDWRLIAQRLASARVHYPNTIIEVEVDSFEQFEHALACGADIILLDNMTPELMARCVTHRNRTTPAVQLEASGGVNLNTVRAIAETGVDRISVGALTHSAPALDIALDYLP